MNADFWRGKKVLVTGGGGFVGRWLARAIAPAGAQLQILDLVEPAKFDVPFEFRRTNLCDLAATRKTLRELRPDVIMHLAGQPGVAASFEDPINAFESNVVATVNLLEAARQEPGAKAIVAVSSNHIYGDQESFPSAEDAALNGRGMYAASKLCGDVYAQAYGQTYGLPVAVARITNSFGGDDHHVTHIVTASIVSALKGQRPIIKNSGRDRKGFMYIKDTVTGLMAVAEGVAASPELRGGAFNLAPSEAISVLDLVKTIIAAVGVNLEPEVKQPNAHAEEEWLDNGRSREKLHWTPQFSLKAALDETIGWYRTQKF